MTETEARTAPDLWWRLRTPRAQLGRLTSIGPLAWAASRAAGAVTGGGRVRAIEAVGLTPGMVKFYGLYFGYVNSLTRLRRADSELVILRTAWNCGAYYEWFTHVYVSRSAGLSVDDVARVGVGPAAAEWSAKQRALLTAVDELTSRRVISDDTWASVRLFFDDAQLADICLLTGNYAMLAMLFNSVDVRPEPGAWQAWPIRILRRDAELGAVLTGDSVRREPAGTALNNAVPVSDSNILTRLCAAVQLRGAPPDRIALGALRAVGPLTWTLSRLGGFATGAGVRAGVAAADAIGMDPRMMRHYLPFAAKLVLGSHLSRPDTELATLRITWNSGVGYEWYYHAHFSRLSGVSPQTVERVAIGPSAPGWNERQRALLTAVDELHTDRFISDDTWTRLRAHYSDRKLAALCLLVGHYDMIGMLFRSFGVEPEPGALRRGPLRLLRPEDDSDRIMPARLPAVNRAVTNRLVRPLAGRAPGLGLLTHTGRKSGKSYHTPVLVLRDGNRVVVPLPYGDTADWVRNVLAAGTAVIRYRGSTLLLSGPRVYDRTGCDEFGLATRFAARVAKVLLAELVVDAAE
ncbi:nitroreductase family deazaflavin-dependent oxidoreductase [Nocardia nepalensis]|uniref:nitroreductase family deazaflavin-dependent oxidoreductase n=1 Tax=Nocardia nepalensis TaxID=3375448 RepID=UPI003B66B8C4